MSFFTVDHDQAGDFSPIPPGEYEAYISSVDIKTFGTGSRGLTAQYTIRDDVDQPARKRKLFDNGVLTEAAMFKFNAWAKAVGIPQGATFNSEDEVLNGFAKAMKGKPVKIKISHDPKRVSEGSKYIERVDAVMASELGGPAGANPFAAAGPTPPPPSDFDAPGDGQAPPPPPADDFKAPWEQ